MHILKEFWYGNINPAERPFQKQRGFDKAFRMLTKNEEKLLETVNEQEKELFDKFKACYGKRKITKILHEEKTPTPAAYAKAQRMNHYSAMTAHDDECYWCDDIKI